MVAKSNTSIVYICDSPQNKQEKVCGGNLHHNVFTPLI